MEIAPHEKTTFTTTEIAERFGVTPRAIRFWGKYKLITPERTRGGNKVRVFSERDCKRIPVIIKLQRMRFSLAKIASLIFEDPETGEVGLNIPPEVCEKQIGFLENQRNEMQQAIEDLKKMLPTR